MKFFLWFVAATIAFVLIARFKPKSTAEPIVPTEAKEAQGSPETDGRAAPARTEEQGRQDAKNGGGGGSTYYVSPAATQRLATAC